MGIMLQRSKITEDLLVTMAQLFGPIPGGLGISVVFVETAVQPLRIVVQLLVAMGLISLPLCFCNYSKPLATGAICASGAWTNHSSIDCFNNLADQLASAADQAATTRGCSYINKLPAIQYAL